MNDREAPEFGRLGDYLRFWATHAPDREALVLDGVRLTYAEYEAAVERCARSLFALGVRSGDRVAMLSTPRPEYPIVLLAALRIGAVWIGLNPRYRLPELQYVAGDARPKALFSLTEFEGRDYRPDLQALAKANPGLDIIVTLGGRVDGLSVPFEAFLDGPVAVDNLAYDTTCAAVRPSDAAVIVYTSGTTGEPKGAMLPHRGFVICYRVQYECWGTEPLRAIANLPINHVGSVGDVVMFCLIAGGTVIFLERFDARRFLEVIEDERVTFVLQVPTILQLVWTHPDVEKYDKRSIQVIVWGGAPMPSELVERLRGLDARLYSCYGLTEAVGNITFNDDDADVEVLANTIGKPHPRFEFRLANSAGDVVPRGEPGEIQLRGDFLMLSYFNRPGATDAAIDAEGWLHTGDLALEREDGNLVFVGRDKEMFKSGGYNVYPQEIETVILSHPDVLMAAVVPAHDRLFSEVGHAFITYKPGTRRDARDLEAYCRERLANYKIPKRFFIVDELPVLPIGKVDKAALGRLAVER